MPNNQPPGMRVAHATPEQIAEIRKARALTPDQQKSWIQPDNTAPVIPPEMLAHLAAQKKPKAPPTRGFRPENGIPENIVTNDPQALAARRDRPLRAGDFSRPKPQANADLPPNYPQNPPPRPENWQNPAPDNVIPSFQPSYADRPPGYSLENQTARYIPPANFVANTTNNEPPTALPFNSVPPNNAPPQRPLNSTPKSEPPRSPVYNVPSEPELLAFVPPPEKSKTVNYDFGTTRERSTIFDKYHQQVNSNYERIDLPSKFIPYDWQDLAIKRFNSQDLILLGRALEQTDINSLVDVLGSTITQDPRTLVIPDFRAIMFWHRMNSFVRSPYTITWTSKYGNENKTIVPKTELVLTEMKMSRQEYLEWKAKGFASPTVSEMEIFDSATLSADARTAMMRAQYLDPEPLRERILELQQQRHPMPSFQARIEIVQNSTPELWEDIRDFRLALGEYGLKEHVKLRDTQFDPQVWLKKLRDNLKQIEDLHKLNAELGLEQQIEIVATEIDALELKMQNGEQITPDLEEVPLNFNAWHLFPNI